MISLFLDVLNLNWKLRRQCPSVLVLRQDLHWEGESVHPRWSTTGDKTRSCVVTGQAMFQKTRYEVLKRLRKLPVVGSIIFIRLFITC